MSARSDITHTHDLIMRVTAPEYVERMTTLLDDYVHHYAEIIREYREEHRPPPGYRASVGTVWFMGGLEKGADLIDPYVQESNG